MIKKYLHTRFRVSDLETSIGFYTKVLGLKVTGLSVNYLNNSMAY